MDENIRKWFKTKQCGCFKISLKMQRYVKPKRTKNISFEMLALDFISYTTMYLLQIPVET